MALLKGYKTYLGLVAIIVLVVNKLLGADTGDLTAQADEIGILVATLWAIYGKADKDRRSVDVD